MKRIKELSIAFIFVLLWQVTYSQDCNYNYKGGSLIFWEKDLKRTPEQVATSEKTVVQLGKCLANTTDKLELAFLHHRLAQMQFSLNALDAGVVANAIAAFEASPDEVCTEYIKLHVWYNDLEGMFPMQKHFLDSLENEVLLPIRSHCLENYKQIYLDKQAKRKAKLEVEMSSGTIIQEYVDALVEIGKKDQVERAKKECNWEIQNHLDEDNRKRLDELYESYGFPTVDLVGSKLAHDAFLVMHHSTDCAWNMKWIPRFVFHDEEVKYGQGLSFFFYRNFNDKDGQCTSYKSEVMEFFEGADKKKVDKMMDFTEWEKLFEEK